MFGGSPLPRARARALRVLISVAAVLVAAIAAQPAAAGTYTLRPDVTHQQNWEATSGSAHHLLLDDDVLAPVAPSTAMDYIYEWGNGPVTTQVGTQTRALAAGETVAQTTAWVYTGMGSKRTLDVHLRSGATTLASVTIPAGTPAGWVTVDTTQALTQAQVDDLRIVLTLQGTGASTETRVYAAYVWLQTDEPADTDPPPAPTIDWSPGSPSTNETPSWSFSGEAGATFECRLERGDGSAVSDWSACSSPRSYDLSSEPDDTYTFYVRATDAASNTGPAATSSYVLDRTVPSLPQIDLSPGATGSATNVWWGFSGDADSYECRLERSDGSAVSAWQACTSPSAYDLSAEPDDTYTFRVRGLSAGGAVGPAASSSYAFDTVPPPAPSIDSSPSSPSNDPTPFWSFTDEAGVAFECRLERDATVVSDWSVCSTPTGYDLSSEPDGSYTFSVRARDAAGNTGDSTSSGYVLDRSVPSAVQIDSSPGPVGRADDPVWAFSGDGATFECRLDRGDGSAVTGWNTCSSPAAYDLSGEPDDVYTFRVRGVSGTGTVGPDTADGYALDTSAPAAPAIDSAPASPSRAGTVAWAFSGESAATFECRLARGSDVVSGWSSCTSPRSYDVSAQPDGEYTLSVRTTDQAGNTGTAATSSYERDTTPPGAPSVTAAPASPANARNPSWSFSGDAGATFECRLQRAGSPATSWQPCASPAAYDLSGEPDGTYSFSVRATDTAGNTGATGSSDYELDATAPGALRIDASPGAVGRERSPAWSFSSEPGDSFECRLIRDSAPVRDWAQCASPQSYDLSGLADGHYAFAVRASDAVGNTGSEVVSDYELDTTAPVVPEVASPASPSRDRTPRWTFSGEQGAALQCRLERGASVVGDWAACTSPHGYDLAGQSDGSYAFSVLAVDRAGNRGPAAAVRYELDTTPPEAPAITSQPRAGDTTPSWSFSAERRATVECRLSLRSKVEFRWAPCDSRRTYNLSGEPDGRYRFQARATDAVGNTGPASDDTYELARSGEQRPDDARPGASPAADPPGGTDVPDRAPDAAPAYAPGGDAAPEGAGQPPSEPAATMPRGRVSQAVGGHRPDHERATARPRRQTPHGRGAAAAERPARAKPQRSLVGAMSETLHKAAAAVREHADKSAFPLTLLLIVAGFLTIQSRLDRNDPKLALAPVFGDPDLYFSASATSHRGTAPPRPPPARAIT